MEKYCKSCGRVFNDLNFKFCPHCKSELATRYGRQPIPRKLRHEVFKRDGYRCRECGASKDETSLEIDHILPVAKGGTNDIDNLQTLCRECNRMKHTDEWVGGETDLEVAENELNNLKEQLRITKERLELSKDKDDIINYKFKIKKLEKEIIPNAENNLEDLKKASKKKLKLNKKRNVQNDKNYRKNLLFKKLYVELEGELLSEVCNHFNLHESSDEANIKKLVNNFPEKTINQFISNYKNDLAIKNFLRKKGYESELN